MMGKAAVTAMRPTTSMETPKTERGGGKVRTHRSDARVPATKEKTVGGTGWLCHLLSSSRSRQEAEHHAMPLSPDQQSLFARLLLLLFLRWPESGHFHKS